MAWLLLETPWFVNQGDPMNNRKLLVQAIAIALAGWSSAASSAPAAIKPDGLLAVDLNRSTIIDGVVSTWGAQLENSGTGLNSEQLRSMLEKLRADQLLAASVAKSLSGLRDVLATAADVQYSEPTSHRVSIEALGDSTQDLVYTPVIPCRILDTRNGTTSPYNAPMVGGSAFTVTANLNNFAPQGGSSSNCGLPANFSAVAVTLTVIDPNFDAYMAASSTSDWSVLNQSVVMNFNAHRGTANSAIVPVDGSMNFYLAMPAQVTTNVIADIDGYFAPPQGGYVASVGAGTGVSVTGTAACGMPSSPGN